MVCPFCLHEKSEIYNTRTTKDGHVIWRRRRCQACGKSFTSHETADLGAVWRVSREGKSPVPYSKAKLLTSLAHACDHRLNPDDTAWYLYEAIEQRLYPASAQTSGLLNSSEITREVAEVLKHFDATAYIKYLSYHQPPMDRATLRKKLRKD